MRHKQRRSSAAWRTSIIAVSLAACSVYDAPGGGSFSAQQASSSAAAGGEPSDDSSLSSAPSEGGLASTSGSAGSSPTMMQSAGTVASSSGSGGSTTVPDAGGAPGASGADGTVNAGGDPSEGGAAPTAPITYRYVKLVALTEQNGHVWSSVAELQVLTTGSKPLASSGWSIMADSEETTTENAPASYAIDGKSTTYWHTHWTWAATNDAPLPHSLIVDLGAAEVVTGFTYLPRQDNKTNGCIKDWAFYLSRDGTTWGSPVKSGSFPSGSTLQTVTF